MVEITELAALNVQHFEAHPEHRSAVIARGCPASWWNAQLMHAWMCHSQQGRAASVCCL